MSTACAARVGHLTCCINTAFGPTCKAHHNPWCIMSFQAMAWAVAQKVNPNQKLVLLTLANYADAHGVCWPSYASLVRDTGLCRRTIISVIDELVVAGALKKDRRRDKRGGNLTNVYRFPLK